MPKAVAIDHMAIYFSKIDEAKRFFLEGLGLEKKADYGDEFFMSIGNQVIAVFEGKNEYQTINHLALKVDDFEGMKEHLQKLGYQIYKSDMVDGPDGIRIQLVP